jgi:anaerobic ribonucleoside-triphosphate reductase activating protein
MQIHAVMDCSLVNGPGRRAVVWFQGCEVRCPGCWNPASHLRAGGFAASAVEVAPQIERAAEAYDLEGVTLSGGEPLHQIAELIELLSLLKHQLPTLSAGIFTGYAERELDSANFHSYFPSTPSLRLAQWRELRSLLDFAVLGRYNRHQPATTPLVSSRNQRLRLFSARYGFEDFQDPQFEISIEPDGLTQITGFPLLGFLE